MGKQAEYDVSLKSDSLDKSQIQKRLKKWLSRLAVVRDKREVSPAGLSGLWRTSVDIPLTIVKNSGEGAYLGWGLRKDNE